MKRLIFGLAAALLLAGAATTGQAYAMPAAPGVIADPIAGSSNAEQTRYVCWWRHGRRVCVWRGGHHRPWRHRHWRHRRW
jgi:hypothetical protein